MKEPLDFIDKTLVAADPPGWKGRESGVTFPLFLAGCLREVTLAPGFARLPPSLQGKLAHLAFLAHLVASYGEVDRLYRSYCRILSLIDQGEFSWEDKNALQEIEASLLRELAEDSPEHEKESGSPSRLTESLYASLESTDVCIKPAVDQVRKSGGRYPCSVCSRRYKSLSALAKHCRAKHSPRDSRDEEKETVVVEGGQEACGDGPLGEAEADTIQSLQCPNCHTTSHSEAWLKNHMVQCGLEAEKKTGLGVQCGLCDKLFETELKLLSHTKKVHSRFLCEEPGCQEPEFSSQASLLAHTRAAHTEPVVCSFCGKKYKNLEFHIYKVHSGREVRCSLCPYTTSLNCHMVSHVQKVHEGRTETCEKCGRVVKGLSHHKIRGCPARLNCERFPCPQCSKTFSLRQGLERHTKAVHLKWKGLSCPHCHYSTGEMFNLKQHIARMHQKKQIVTNIGQPQTYHGKDCQQDFSFLPNQSNANNSTTPVAVERIGAVDAMHDVDAVEEMVEEMLQQ